VGKHLYLITPEVPGRYGQVIR